MTKQLKRPEVLSPAGTLEKLKVQLEGNSSDLIAKTYL